MSIWKRGSCLVLDARASWSRAFKKDVRGVGGMHGMKACYRGQDLAHGVIQ